MTITNTFLMFLLAFTILLIALSMQYSHLLLALFCLEAMLLTTMIMVVSLTHINSMYMPHLAMLLLTMGACEASIGLSLMVHMSRSIGSDMMSSLSVNKC